MKLFLLRPKKDLNPKNNPWEPWYDKCFGSVVRAENEEEARKIAHKSALDENEKLTDDGIENLQPWLDEKYSTCVELKNKGSKGEIISDCRNA